MSSKTSSDAAPKASRDAVTQQEAYSAPKVVTLGKAVRVVQQNSVGQFFDGAATVSRTYT